MPTCLDVRKLIIVLDGMSDVCIFCLVAGNSACKAAFKLMKTPLTDKLVQNLAIKELESERIGVTMTCKFDEIVEFARTLEAKLNGSNVTCIVREGSTLTRRSGASGIVSGIDEINMTISIKESQAGKIRQFSFRQFIEKLDLEQRTQGMTIDF